MRRVALPLTAALGLSMASIVGAQMMPNGGGMGGGRHTMVNLVSPADSATQIARGVVMVGAHAGVMGGPRTPTPGAANGTRRFVLMLRLSGVSAGGQLVDSSGNRLLFNGRLSSADGEEPVAVDAPFAISHGSALLVVPIDLPALTGAAALLIDQVSVLDAAAATFAVPGVAIASPPTPRPTRTPAPTCTSDGDCDDGDAATRDFCTPMGCRHSTHHRGGPMR